MFLSAVIPTYNRLPILRQCLIALERQELALPIERFEVVLVDDGSTDDTVAWLQEHAASLPHVRLICQDHGGPAAGRNRGVEHAEGDVIVFIDSDLVVLPDFLQHHARALEQHWRERGNKLCFTYGAVVNTANFENPTSEPHKLNDVSFAYFATGNVAIDRQVLERAGLFDTSFRLYGWEDLELGERLRRLGVDLVRCPPRRGLPLASGPQPGANPAADPGGAGAGENGTRLLPQTPHSPGSVHHPVHLAAPDPVGTAHPGRPPQ